MPPGCLDVMQLSASKPFRLPNASMHTSHVCRPWTAALEVGGCIIQFVQDKNNQPSPFAALSGVERRRMYRDATCEGCCTLQRARNGAVVSQHNCMCLIECTLPRPSPCMGFFEGNSNSKRSQNRTQLRRPCGETHGLHT